MNTWFVRILNFLHRPLRKNAADDPYHRVLSDFISLASSMSSPEILEIGSRNVSGTTRRHLFPGCGEYVGFDIHPGDGVDVVGDAHKLSSYFSSNRFDLVLSVSVFEHLLFPWKVVMEMNRVMKPGAFVYLSTHPAWPTHELPWDFWRFQHNGFHALFNSYTGFEIVSLIEGLPCRPYSLVNDPPTIPVCFHTLNQGIAVIAKKTNDYREDLLRWDINISDVVNTIYPNNKSPS
ncbi:MAG: methyltransferase domain-containing protein [Methylothermaceae bacterium]|nr:methyltransferase domain-containing protein [Methylothermaceae bacterium]